VDESTVRVGVLGCGNVGAALIQLIEDRGDDIAARTGLRLEVTRVAVRNLAKARPVELPDQVVTHDAGGVVDDPDVDLVVEVIGGIEPARTLTLDALKAGKPVVSANKELLASMGAEIFDAADAAGVDVLFEAAVAGAIPLIRPLRESLAGERITRVMGIVNGTTNYILTRMTEAGASYQEALAEAQSLGFAERDPTADVEGFDAGAKAASATVREYARVLGLPVKALDGYSQKLKLSLRGLSDDQVQAAIAQAVADFGSGMAKVYELPLSQFQRAGEGLADTLARLAGLQTFSDTIADLGGVFARVAGLGVDAREAFIAMAGGMVTLLANAHGFVQEYYSRDEIAGIKAAELKDALAAVGITQDVNSRGEFRALVDSLDVSSQAGQEQLAALLGMAQAFTQVADYMAETGGTLAGTAALAPAGGAGAALFAPGGQGDQLLAINNVGFWTEAVFNAVKQLTSVVQGGTGSAAPVPVPAPEVNAGWIGVSGGGG